MTDAIDCLEGYLKGRGDKMKAADIVMSRRCVVNKEPALGGYILWIAGVGRVGFCPLEKEAKKYAKEITSALEISFKAGIKEVADWVNEQISEMDRTGYYPLREMWQVKLKEWGV